MTAPACTAERVYEYVHAPHKNAVLLDRLWPRGIRRAQLENVAWEKDASPSTELRRWFHENPDARFAEFCGRFRQELQTPAAQAALQRLRAMPRPLILLTAAKNPAHSHIAVLLQELNGC
ncbi:MAG: DUF488 domain-containing protein [Ottowia sp.]